MKQIIITCDRCKRDISDGMHLIRVKFDKEYDLCTDCYVSSLGLFENWIKSYKDKLAYGNDKNNGNLSFSVVD